MNLNEFMERIKEQKRYHYVRMISWSLAILLCIPLLIINSYARHLTGFIVAAATASLGIYLIKNSYQSLSVLKILKKWTDDRLKDIPGTQEVKIQFFDPSDKE